MRVLIFAAALAVTLLASPSSGFSMLFASMRCVGGPAQWCRDVESARDCNAEQYCKDKVWKREEDVAHNIRKNDAGEVIFSSFPSRINNDDNDRIFESMNKIMEMQMKEMEGMMKSFMGPDEGDFFQRAFDDSLGDFFSPKMAFARGSIKDNDNDKITNINNIFTLNNVVGNNDGNKVETEKDHEREEEKEEKMKGEEEEKPQGEGDDVCGVCINITTEIRDKMLTKAMEEEVVAALEGVCKKLGPIEGMCDEAVKTYVPKYFEMARNVLNNPKMLCEFAGLCSPTKTPFKDPFPDFPSMENSPSNYKISAQTCSLCSTVAQGLKSLMRMPGFAQNLPSAACAFADENDEECLELMTSFVEVFYEQLDPAIVCASSFCTNSGVDVILEEAEERLRQDAEVEEMEEEAPKTTEAPTTAPPPKPLPKICRKCIHHTKRSIRVLRKKLWREKRRWLWGCKFALNKTKCEAAVESFIHHAEQKLKHICPMKVCAKLGFCPAINRTSSFAPHDREDVDATSFPESLKSVPATKLEPAVETLPMRKLEMVAHSLDDDLENDVCTYCEEVVNYIKILIGNPDAKKEIEELLLAQCSALGIMQQICERFVEADLDGLIDRIAHVDTKQTCVMMHLCSADGSFQTLLSSVAASSACSSCKNVVKEGLMPLISSSGSERDLAIGLCHAMNRDNLVCHNHLSNMLKIAKARFNIGRSEAEAAVESVCQPLCRSGLAADWDECLAAQAPTTTSVTTTAAPTTEAPTTAAAASTTEVPTTEVPTTPEPAPQPPVCKRCIAVLSVIKKQLTNKLSCIEGKLTKACGLLPPLKEECQSAVEAFFAPLVAKITRVEPEVVCVNLGVCIPSEAQIVGAIVPPLPLITRVDLGFSGGKIRQLADVFGGIGPMFPADDVFPDLGFLDEKKKKPEVEATAEKPDDGKIRVGSEKTSSSSSSSSMRRSSSSSSSSEVLTMNSANRISEDAACTVCNYLVDDLKEFKGVTRDEMKAVLLGACTKLPVKQRDECIEFMVPILGEAVEFLAKIPTKEICQVFKTCPVLGSFPLSTKLGFSSMQCFACKFAVNEVKSVWSNPNVPATINSTLHSICLKLPVDYQPQCHGAIDQTFPVIDGMLKDMDPEEVCEAIGACEEAKRKQLLGADDCHWNLPPKVYCSDWKRAVRCEGIDFCKKSVWGRD